MLHALDVDVLLEGDAEGRREEVGEMGRGEIFLFREIVKPDLGFEVAIDIGDDSLQLEGLFLNGLLLGLADDFEWDAMVDGLKSLGQAMDDAELVELRLGEISGGGKDHGRDDFLDLFLA